MFGKVTRLPAPANYAQKINRWQFNFALQPPPCPPKYSGNVFTVCSFCVSKYTAEINGKFSLRLEKMFKCSTQISNVYSLEVLIENLNFIFKKKIKIISLNANSRGPSQHGFSTTCQNYAPKFYRKILQALFKVYIKYIVNHKFELL